MACWSFSVEILCRFKGCHMKYNNELSGGRRCQFVSWKEYQIPQIKPLQLPSVHLSVALAVSTSPRKAHLHRLCNKCVCAPSQHTAGMMYAFVSFLGSKAAPPFFYQYISTFRPSVVHKEGNPCMTSIFFFFFSRETSLPPQGRVCHE